MKTFDDHLLEIAKERGFDTHFEMTLTLSHSTMRSFLDIAAKRYAENFAVIVLNDIYEELEKYGGQSKGTVENMKKFITDYNKPAP